MPTLAGPLRVSANGRYFTDESGEPFFWLGDTQWELCRSLTLEDVRGILTGGNTAATDFFRRKTHDKLYVAFKPIVSQKVGEVGATRAYKNMMGRYESVPMMGGQSLDLDDYVTKKSLDGLFYMVGEEEKKIRTNPAARTTDLLKTVFGK